MKYILVLIAAASILSGCNDNDDRQAAQQAVASSLAPAPAAPPGFPDLSDFTPSNSEDYRQSYPYFNGIIFTTPDGMMCDYNYMNSRQDPNHVVISCLGPHPAEGPGTWNVRAASDEVGSVALGEVKNRGAKPPPLPLPPRHTISYEGILCGVDVGLTACRIGDHGFVLTPTETKLF